MSRVAFASSGRRTFLRRFTDSSWRTCVLTTPVRSRHSCSTRALARACLSPAVVSWAYIRMFVSTKYLSLMELVARLGRRPLQVKAFAQSSERPTAGLVEALSFPDDGLQAVRQKRADRAAF